MILRNLELKRLFYCDAKYCYIIKWLHMIVEIEIKTYSVG